jgi:hypothetical protein
MPRINDPLWITVILAILVLAGVWAYSRRDQQRSTHQRTQAAEPQKGRNPSSQVERPSYKENSENGSGNRDNHDRTIRNWTAVIAASGVFAVIFSAFTLDAMRGQLDVMRDQLKEARSSGEDAKKAIEATNRLANESKRQADLAQQNLHLSHRPWVDFENGPQIDEPLTFLGNGTVTISVKTSARNVANSPAVNVTFESKLHLDDWPSGDMNEIIKNYICEPEKSNYTGAPFSQIIMPNAVVALWPSKDVSNKIDKNKPQTSHGWVSACLRYEDEFGIPHSTGQIFIYIPDDGSPMPAAPSGPIPGTLKAYTGKIMK